jgi:hypothetical protein
MKLSEKEIQKKIGKREPLPGGPKQKGPNFLPRPAAPAASAPARKSQGVNFLNPRAVNAKREKEAGLAKGGKVRGKR